jgi:hypothetical protein
LTGKLIVDLFPAAQNTKKTAEKVGILYIVKATLVNGHLKSKKSLENAPRKNHLPV